MLVNKHSYLQSSLYPNMNWTNDEYYIVDETLKENFNIVQKIKDSHPNIELIVKDGKLIDVKVKEVK